MPYILKGNCVVKKDTGETVKCHDSLADAKKHLAALNIAYHEEHEMKKLPPIWVLAHPFGDAKNKDGHGEYFDNRTKFYDELLQSVPVSYYHNYSPEGTPQDDAIPIGTTDQRVYRSDGRWDHITFFDDERIPDEVRERLAKAIDDGTIRTSPTVVPDFHRVKHDGHISHWLAGSISVFDAAGMRQPANKRAIGTKELKSLFKATGLEFPTNLEHKKEQTMADKATVKNALSNLFKALTGKSEEDEMWEDVFGEDNPDDTETPKPEQRSKDNAISLQLNTQGAQMKALQEQNSTLLREIDQSKFERWFDEMLNGGKVVPAERDATIAMLHQLNADDKAAHPTMKWQGVDDKEIVLSRVDAFKQSIAQRPNNHLVKGATINDFQAQGDGKEMSAERRAALLKTTALGEEILAEQAAKRNGNYN